MQRAAIGERGRTPPLTPPVCEARDTRTSWFVIDGPSLIDRIGISFGFLLTAIADCSGVLRC
jgi:hypothetical protein